MLTEQQKLVKYQKSIMFCKVLAIIDKLNNKILGELTEYQIGSLKLNFLESLTISGEEKTISLYGKLVYERINDLELDAEKIFQKKMIELVGG